MITRLPAWVRVGAASLAMVAGLVNVVGYPGFEHQAVTHLTGTTTPLGAAAVGAQWRSVAQLVLVIIAFVGGAILSGFIIRDSALRLGRRYGVALAIEACLLWRRSRCSSSARSPAPRWRQWRAGCRTR
jgi:uncharacterized membrane protein YoaK (UPF0700 family)